MNQPEICIEVAEDERWLGGAIYIENLLSTLATLTASDRPIVRLAIHSNTDTPFVHRLRSMEIVSRTNPCGGVVWRAIKRVDRALGGLILQLMQLTNKPKFNRSNHELWFPAFEINLVPRNELYWIPDFQHFYLPHLFTESELALRNSRFENIASANGILLLSSKTALDDFVSRYPNAHVIPRVWSFCSSLPEFGSIDFKSVLAQYHLPEKFLYVPNQFWQHKDHLTAFKALKLLSDMGLNIPLVCTGYQGDYRSPQYFETVKSYLEENGLTRQIFMLGVIPREHQIQIFRCAAAVLQPSLFEGWSTVIEDAKALGRPIIASDISVHREQLQFVAEATFFSASNPAELADLLIKLWPKLDAGPNLRAEYDALERTLKRRRASANEFMSIVQEAITCFTTTAQFNSQKARGK